MDKYDYKIEQLAQRIRRLEAESLPSGMTEEVRALMDDLELVPAADRDSAYSRKLNERSIATILEDLGYDTKMGEDYILIETEVGKIEVCHKQLPVITISNGYLLKECDEGLNSIKRAASDVTMFWDMVKAIVDSEGEHLVIYLDARHDDAASFRQNIHYYIEQIVGATKDFTDRYHGYERDRWLAGLRVSPKQLAS